MRPTSPPRRAPRAFLVLLAALASAATTVLFGAALAGAAHAAPIETVQSGSSSIQVNGNVVADDSDAQTDSRVSTVATYGTFTTREVRTAARSSSTGEIASNVRMDDKMQFSNTNVTETISAATLVYHSAPENALLRHAALDFTLPASFMEVSNFGEVLTNALEMVLFADLRVCFATICGLGDSLFSFQSILTGSFQSFTLSTNADGDPSLDLDPLRHPVVTDGTAAFVRTTTVDFAAFHGHLDLGLVPTNAPLTVEYQIQTRGRGRMLANVGLAGINDPFLLDTDPVPAGALVLTLSPAAAVPEPEIGLLMAGGLALLCGPMRRRMRR
jgi:hypothetical protein